MHANTLSLEIFWKSSKDKKNNSKEGEAKGKTRQIYKNPKCTNTWHFWVLITPNFQIPCYAQMNLYTYNIHIF